MELRKSGGRGSCEQHSVCFSGGFPSRTVTIQQGDRAERRMTGHLEAELPEEEPRDVTGLRRSLQAVQLTHTWKNLHAEYFSGEPSNAP